MQDGRVLRYTDTSEEYWAVKRSAGLGDLSHLGRLNVSGKDRIAFLNGLLTNDIAKLKENSGIHSLLLNTKARVLADLYVHSQPGSMVVDTCETSAERVKETLDQFIITEDVKIEDATRKTVLITVQGHSSAQILKETLKVEIGDLRPLQSLTLGPSLIIARDRTGQGGYDILLPSDEAEAVWQGFMLKGEHSPVPVGLDALEILRLEAGLPRYGVDVNDATIVLEAGYQDAISFTKGCYMGQEVVARATHIGRVNRRLVQLEVDTEKRLDNRSRILADGGEVGSITSSAFSPGVAKTFAMGYVGRESASAGRELAVASGGEKLRAIVRKIV